MKPAFEGRGAGKVILFGEHAVVYGVPGIAAGIERGAVAHASQTGERSTLRLGTSEVYSDELSSDLARSFAALLAPETAPLSVTARADIPPGGGLGCSAALGVAIARAVLLATNASDEQAVFERAMAWERVYHGNPSGIDTAAALLGTFLRYERGQKPSELVTSKDLWLAVGYSGKSASTKAMVEGIAELQHSAPALHRRFLEGVQALVEQAERCLAATQEDELGALFDANQQLLREVHLSTESIDDMCHAAREAGAKGVKLTGSGGGGSVIALGGFCAPDEDKSSAAEQAQRIADAWSARGYLSFPTRIRARQSGSKA